MCRNIVYGRYHEPCGHFKPMDTCRKDCMRHACCFSYRHPPECSLKFCRCKRSMDAPIHNPIRFSPNKCPDCVEIERLEEQKRLEEQETLIEKERPQAESEPES